MSKYDEVQRQQIVDKDTGISTDVKNDTAGEAALVTAQNFTAVNSVITYATINPKDRVVQIVETDIWGKVRTTNITYVTPNSDQVASITQTVV